jgi:uncharacterized protein YkwD
MIALVLGVLLAATPPESPPSLTPQEQRSARHVLLEFERVGRRAPRLDAALTQAARQLAQGALDKGVSGAVELVSVIEAVSRAGGSDPSPRSYVIRAETDELAVQTLLARKDLGQEPTSHLGVGMASQGRNSALVVLLAERKGSFRPFPRAFAGPGSGQTLCGQLEEPLRSGELYVTQPDGRVEHPPVFTTREGDVCARLRFAVVGRYTLELVGKGARGPEVAALFVVDVGTPQRQDAREALVEPTTVAEARTAVLARINALRLAHQLPQLYTDPALTRVAQAYGERMAREGFFSHVAPDGLDLRGRLSAAGIRYRSSGENLGLASGPLAAHQGIELSPGHRGNLLNAQFTLAGLGVAFQSVDGRPQVVLVEVFASGGVPALPADAREELVQVLATHRASHGLNPLKRLPQLDALAQEQARRALAANLPPAQLPGEPVHERIFKSVQGATRASMDFYVTDDPSSLPDSKNLAERKNSLLGVGSVRGDSPTLGKDRYWVVVLYASTL